MSHVRNTIPKHLKTKGHPGKGYTVQKSQIITWDCKKDTNSKRQHPLPPPKYKPKGA